MTRHTLQRWLAGQAFYRLELARFGAAEPTLEATTPDNPDQRIQEDIQLFTSDTVGLSLGLLDALVTLGSFVGILWMLSGGFSFVAHFSKSF
jgi:putative ATP-binding cassette transporter